MERPGRPRGLNYPVSHGEMIERASSISRLYRDEWRKIITNLGLYKCFRCGEDRFYLVHFHHTNLAARKKVKQNASVIFRTKPREERVRKFVESIKSGEVLPLCANCHTEEHFLNGGRGRSRKYRHSKQYKE
jgi:hypothetical protein